MIKSFKTISTFPFEYPRTELSTKSGGASASESVTTSGTKEELMFTMESESKSIRHESEQ